MSKDANWNQLLKDILNTQSGIISGVFHATQEVVSSFIKPEGVSNTPLKHTNKEKSLKDE